MSDQDSTPSRLDSCLQPWLTPNVLEESNGKRKKAKHTAPGPLSKALPAQQNSFLPPAGRQLGLCHVQALLSALQGLKKKKKKK